MDQKGAFHNQDGVSILVLLDVALKGASPAAARAVKYRVSILVLLDVALKVFSYTSSDKNSIYEFQSLFSWMLL